MRAKLILLGVTALMLAFLAGTPCGFAAEQKYDLKLAQLFATDSDLGKSARQFAALVKEKSGGRISISVFDGGQLGGQKEVYDALLRGVVDFNMDWPMTSYNQKLAVVFAPYMFTSWEQAKAAYAVPDGWLTKIVGKVFEESKIKYLGPYPYEFSGVTLNAAPATNSDMAKGIKVRVPPIEPFMSVWEALGFIPTPIDYAETPTAIQTGVVDGQVGGGPEQAWSDFRDVSKYYIHYKDYFSCAQFMMNQDLWNRMSPSDREIIVQAAAKVIADRFVQAEASERRYIEELGKAKVQVIQLSPEDAARAKKLVREKVWPKLAKLVGEDIITQIKANAEK
jgi:TRAP-type C4-dicarboxylate transport system, periplasmic component